MRLRHLFPAASSRREIPNRSAVAFFIRQGSGAFLSVYPTVQTRYQGWFMPDKDHFYKIVDRIEVVNQDRSLDQVVSLTHTPQGATFEYQSGLKLSWEVHPGKTGICLNLSKEARLRLILDMRAMYQFPHFQRNYTLSSAEKGSVCQVEYQDEFTGRPLALWVKSKTAFTPVETWQEESYPLDEARHSPPFQLYTFVAAETSTTSLILGAGFSLPEATNSGKAASALEKHPFGPQNVGINYSHDTLLNQISTAKSTVNQALRYLQSPRGLYAGLPWFHQVWSRDELITALGLPPGQQEEIIQQYLGKGLRDGELPTFQGASTTCADGVGWLCLLVQEFGIEKLSPENRNRLKRFLLTAHDQLRAHRQAGHGLIASLPQATWMDTLPRAGYRIEIQSMYALLLEMLFFLTGNQEFGREHLRFLGKVRQQFYQNGYLWDGHDDPTIRPNIFIAYLTQPDLLPASSWESVFDTALKALRCPWGGLSSLDHSSPNFKAYSSGEDNLSYHQGDSWFFINNLAAIALHRFNHHRYGSVIVDILQSSTEEILWHNFLGMPGEISSAAVFDSWGCGLQAFSGGSYLALLEELEVYSMRQGSDSNASFWEATSSSRRANLER